LRLNFETFKCIVKNTPLISIDFLVKKDNKYLLGKRVNEPAKGYYFTIGGRIFKNEKISDAQKRILQQELNLSLATNRLSLKFIGIFEHFYNTSIFGSDVSTHYINMAYILDLNCDFEIKNIPFDQHNEYIWLSEEEILKREDVHKYVKDYFKGSKYV